jgi:catechol 2,3-dioxygenase-like lactoylglutathione lyase family enzyme
MAAILDHVGLGYADYDKAKTFFAEALAPLGIGIVMEVGDGADRACGFGRGKPDFWIAAGERTTPHIHVAFIAESRAAVRAFYEAALKAGGTDNGPPGIRAHYHPDYYGAFVLDPEGQNIEAVCHKPE